MTRKAVDIVLLPSERMADIAIELNRQLVEKFGPEIILHKQNCLPHISLAMGCLDEKDVPEVERILQKIAQQHPVKNLKVTGIHQATNAVGQIVSAFEIEKTNKLQKLHETVMTQCESYLTRDATEDMLYGTEEIAESTLLWIRNYRDRSSFERFSPHITIGYGSVDEPVELPMEFEVAKLALCHLGNHCTCREILASFVI